MQNKTYKILLLSGGADSMLLYQRYEYDKIIFFNYGQEHKEDEFINCKEFINNISLFNVKIETPLINITKKEILKELNLPYFTD